MTFFQNVDGSHKNVITTRNIFLADQKKVLGHSEITKYKEKNRRVLFDASHWITLFWANLSFVLETKPYMSSGGGGADGGLKYPLPLIFFLTPYPPPPRILGQAMYDLNSFYYRKFNVWNTLQCFEAKDWTLLWPTSRSSFRRRRSWCRRSDWWTSWTSPDTRSNICSSTERPEEVIIFCFSGYFYWERKYSFKFV